MDEKSKQKAENIRLRSGLVNRNRNHFFLEISKKSNSISEKTRFFFGFLTLYWVFTEQDVIRFGPREILRFNSFPNATTDCLVDQHIEKFNKKNGSGRGKPKSTITMHKIQLARTTKKTTTKQQQKKQNNEGWSRLKRKMEPPIGRARHFGGSFTADPLVDWGPFCFVLLC